MEAPRIPSNEKERLETLLRLRILDTPSDDRYDRYTQICTRLFDVPIAVISLVDKYRQWFKSACGLDARETPRKISFCGHAILNDDIFEVQDALQD
ncbi:MAG: GGDEF domain-containing protein, partial [Gammaproteobacteria bacterium]|nr:GGDEF domain-containing protein [Gammaproteobacteria bacterium]